VRGRPEPGLPIGERGRRRNRCVDHHILGVVAAEPRTSGANSARSSCCPHREAARALGCGPLLAERGGVVVHEPRKALRVELRLWQRLLRPVSESGRLHHGNGAHRRGDRRRNGARVAMLYTAMLDEWLSSPAKLQLRQSVLDVGARTPRPMTGCPL
jgi:hypothetical protein